MFPQIGGQQFASGDGPAALLPDGNVLVAASPLFTAPGDGPPPTHFFEFDGSSLTPVADPPNPPADPHANTLSENTLPGRMLMLPTGQVLFTEWSSTVWVYNPAGTFKEPWRPTIEQGPFTLVRGRTYQVYGRLFNGRSGGSSFGDNYQGPTNYPLIRLTDANGQVFYCFTFSPSTSGVAVNGRVSTNFLVPSDIAAGDYQLEVVTNGIPSRPKPASVM
jgi:hypothetical protein